jgi:hypothetical protein
MDNSDIKTYRSRLPLSLAACRNDLVQLLLRLRGIGLRAGTSPKLHRKFMRLMEQISMDREREIHFLCEIEEMEKLHKNMKRHNRLRRARQAPPTSLPPIPEEAVSLPQMRENPGLLGWLAVLTTHRINHKNQDLTVD